MTLRMTVLVLAMLLSACGGSDTDTSAEELPDQSGAAMLPTVWTSEGRAYNSCSLEPQCSGNPFAPFTAVSSAAPGDGAVLRGVVRLELTGIEMANAELLPANAYLPRHGVFNITGDQTRAWLDFDTTRLPNGPLPVRVSVFDVPPGGAGAREIVAMPARTWIIDNASIPSAGFSAAVTVAPAPGAVIGGIRRLEVRGGGLVNVELLPASGYARLGVFNVSADRSHAWLDFDTRALPDGVTQVRISAFNRTEGQPGASEIVAMPARQWELRNGGASGATFSATVTIAPPHGEIVDGNTRLEVRGRGLENVELLPATGYLPRLGAFRISGDKTFAWLDIDLASAAGGASTLDARISAFSVPPGGAGAREIIAMPVRRWELR